METILQFVKSANSITWNSLLLIILCGTGIYYTFRLRFIQVRKFGEAFKLVFSNIKLKGAKSKNGEMSSFQALATAIAAQVGTGNLTGAATALSAVVPVQSSGCGSAHFSEWQLFTQRLLSLRNIK